MVSLVDKTARIAPATDRVELPDPGVYYPADIRSIVSEADSRIWRDRVSLTEAQLNEWSNNGFFSLFEPDAGRIRRRAPYASFLGLISVRMVALFKSFGVASNVVSRVIESIKGCSQHAYPLATRAIWEVDALADADEIDAIQVSTEAIGSISFRDLRREVIAPNGGLEFEDDLASVWRPAQGVWINTRFQGGLPCVDGTRVTTSVLWTFSEEGIAIPDIADDFDLTEQQVQDSIDWHSRLGEVAA